MALVPAGLPCWPTLRRTGDFINGFHAEPERVAPGIDAPLTRSVRLSDTRGMSQIQCLVIGVDNHVGAYLARLLDARGVGKGGGLGGVGDHALLSRLGIADAVAGIEAFDAATVAADARLVFAIDDGSAERADLLAAVIDRIGAAVRPPRLLHVADVADLTQPGVRDGLRRVQALRGVDAATILLAAHDSRLGRPDTVMAQVIAAAARTDAAPASFAETGPRDWGWTPEYVDAVQRMASRDRLTDMVVASGHPLTVAEIAEHALVYFRKPASGVTVSGNGSATAPIDTTSLLAATGWRATTVGGDLVRALCEGASDRA